ncbi:MAG: hypothetical protein L0191_07025, partial [Acidobacteria bacterium]|nr:hypothetical protein [Acidobacteriota bacterium]
MDSKKVLHADQAKYGEVTSYNWSPDSRWLTYHKTDFQGFRQVFIYSLDSGKVTRATSEIIDSYSPAFDPEGKYLYFLSDRDLNAELGAFDFSYVYSSPTKVYALTLRKDLPSLFAPESDEVGGDKKPEGEPDKSDADSGKDDKEKGKSKDSSKDGKKDEKKAPEPVKIDLEGIENRITVFPMEPGNYGQLSANKAAVFFMAGGPALLTGGGDGAGKLHAFDLEKRKDGVLLEGVNGYDLSPDGTKLGYMAGEIFGIIDAKPGQDGKPGKVGDGALKTDGMQTLVDYAVEYQQMFDEAWRLERDFFYVPNMQGVDWPAMKKKYGVLVPHSAHRTDLTYTIGEMI